MNTVRTGPLDKMLCDEIVACMHPISSPNSSAMAIGRNHVSVVVAVGLVLFCAVSLADIMFDGWRYFFSQNAGVEPPKMQSFTMQLNNHNYTRMGVDGLAIFGPMLSATVMMT